MSESHQIHGVYLSETMDLHDLYGPALGLASGDVVLHRPEEVTNPDEIAFALCWLPGEAAFVPFPNLRLAMSIGAGVDALLNHPGLSGDVAIARVRDPHQADLMAGFAVHEVLRDERGFDAMAVNARKEIWQPLQMRAPSQAVVAVLGHGTMGRAVAKGLAALGFNTRVACRTAPAEPLEGVAYLTGPDAPHKAAAGADYLINVLPLTSATENILNADLFGRLAPGARLIQIGRGEHLQEGDLLAALDTGQIAGATLDVFREEPLPKGHPFWHDTRLRITPHIASDSVPEIVAAQVVETARALRDGQPLAFGIDRARGY